MSDINKLRSYDPNEKCCKCGCDTINDSFKPGNAHYDERMYRTCMNCGFSWESRCLDYVVTNKIDPKFDPEH